MLDLGVLFVRFAAFIIAHQPFMIPFALAANHAHGKQVQPGFGPADGRLRQRHREGLQGLQRSGAHLHINVPS